MVNDYSIYFISPTDIFRKGISFKYLDIIFTYHSDNFYDSCFYSIKNGQEIRTFFGGAIILSKSKKVIFLNQLYFLLANSGLMILPILLIFLLDIYGYWG